MSETLAKLNTDLLNENNLLPTASFFLSSPESFSDYKILAGSTKTDEITGLPGEFIFHGEGSDNILSKKGYDYSNSDKLNIFFGDGQYKFEKGTFTVSFAGGLYDMSSFKKDKLEIWDISDTNTFGSFEESALFITDGLTKLLIADPTKYNSYFKIGKKIYSEDNFINSNNKYKFGELNYASLVANGNFNLSTIAPLIENNLETFQTNENLLI